jgi:hypothetical protein
MSMIWLLHDLFIAGAGVARCCPGWLFTSKYKRQCPTALHPGASVSASIIGGGLFARIDVTMHVFVEFDQLVEVFRYLLQKFLVFGYY